MWSLTAGAALSGLPWTSFLTSLNISFSCCEMGIINPMFIVWIEGDDANCFAANCKRSIKGGFYHHSQASFLSPALQEPGHLQLPQPLLILLPHSFEPKDTSQFLDSAPVPVPKAAHRGRYCLCVGGVLCGKLGLDPTPGPQGGDRPSSSLRSDFPFSASSKRRKTGQPQGRRDVYLLRGTIG